MEDGDPLGSQPCPRDVISCPVLRTPFLGVKKHMTLAWGCLVPFLRPFLVGMGRERRLPSVGTYPDTDPSLIATHHEQALGGCDLRSGLPRHPVLRTCQLAYVTASQLHRIPPTRTQWHPLTPAATACHQAPSSAWTELIWMTAVWKGHPAVRVQAVGKLSQSPMGGVLDRLCTKFQIPLSGADSH